MSNSTDGNKVRILANQNRQASEDHTAECIASALSKIKTETHESLMAAISAAEQVQSAERLLRMKFGYTLEKVYELRCQFRPDPAGRQKPDPSNTRVGIWSVENSEYTIIELVRFIVGDILKLASLKACVKLLQHAERENVAPENFRRFMHNAGRIDVNVRVVNKPAKKPGAAATLLKYPAKGR